MPVCSEPDCPSIVERSGRCDEHRRRVGRVARARYVRNRYGSEWARISAIKLRASPICECADQQCRCAGQCDRSSTEVDHVIPFRMFNDRRAANRAPLHALCKSCHARKTALEVGLGGARSHD